MKIDFRSIDVAKRLAPLAHSEIIEPADHAERFFEWEKRQEISGITLPWEKLSGRFEFKPGTLTMLAGYTGHFKSTITTQMILEAMRQGKRVGLASLELELGQILEQMIEIASTASNPTEEWKRKFIEWTRGKLFVYDRVDAIAPEDATALTYACKDLGCDLVVIDALMMCGLENEDYGAERDFAQAIQTIAKAEQLAVLMVHHTRKPQGPDGESRKPHKYDLMGSSYLVNLCNGVLMCWHDKAKSHAREIGGDYDDDKPCLVISVQKNRGGPFEGSVGLWQHPTGRGFCSNSRRQLKPIDVSGVTV
jgi:twinkle protein